MVSDILCGPHVLAIHRSNVDRLGLLGLVRMFGPGVNAQITELHPAQWSPRNHPLDRLLDHPLGKTALEDRLCGAFLDAADEAGVIVIDLVVALAPGKHDMRRVDDDDVVTAIDVGRIGREVFAAQAHRTREASWPTTRPLASI